MFTHRNDEMDPSRNPILRLVRKRVPITDDYHGQRFWVKEAGKLGGHPAVHRARRWSRPPTSSSPSTPSPRSSPSPRNPFLVFTSNAFAILGLRAMYFLLADLIDRFIYLKAGLAAILVFVGIKMLLLDVYKIPIWLSLTVIATLITVAVVASLRATRDLEAPPSLASPASHSDEAAECEDSEVAGR